MVCLPCRRVKKPAATINVWFIVNKGSNYSFLAKETIEALIGKNDPFPNALRVAMQDPGSKIECHISPSDGNFADANVLVMQTLRILKVSIDVD
uniref:DUF1758 domain-containing protein n=1 Tax=Heterorhabditis bacteriophora TaxID=37862 RepID=A0A1I7XLI7_HETBA